jgi:hypothetical protein
MQYNIAPNNPQSFIGVLHQALPRIRILVSQLERVYKPPAFGHGVNGHFDDLPSILLCDTIIASAWGSYVNRFLSRNRVKINLKDNRRNPKEDVDYMLRLVTYSLGDIDLIQTISQETTDSAHHDRRSYLVVAADAGHTALVHKIVDRGLDLDVKQDIYVSKGHFTYLHAALHNAVDRGAHEMIDIFLPLAKGTGVDQMNLRSQLLFDACRIGRANTVNHILQCEPVSLTKRALAHPLTTATAHYHIDCQRLLLQYQESSMPKGYQCGDSEARIINQAMIIGVVASNNPNALREVMQVMPYLDWKLALNAAILVEGGIAAIEDAKGPLTAEFISGLLTNARTVGDTDFCKIIWHAMWVKGQLQIAA